MASDSLHSPNKRRGKTDYKLDEQAGFLLRQANQRHAAIFSARNMDDLTPTQWAVIAKLFELGSCSQNLLGRHVAMDAATTMGVIKRLVARDLVTMESDPADARLIVLQLSADGEKLFRRLSPVAQEITHDTLAPLLSREQKTFLRLLGKIC
ncbi:MAG: MarR family winged helix-turn-helix transcriptional regulator [Beijerinckiaceae bacterium]